MKQQQTSKNNRYSIRRNNTATVPINASGRSASFKTRAMSGWPFGKPIFIVVVLILFASISGSAVADGRSSDNGTEEVISSNSNNSKNIISNENKRFLQYGPGDPRPNMRRCLRDAIQGRGRLLLPERKLPENPDDLDPLRFGPGTIPPSSGYDAETVSRFQDCYDRFVLDYVEKYFVDDPTTPIYDAPHVEVLCCGGIPGGTMTDAPTKSPIASPTESPTSKPRVITNIVASTKLLKEEKKNNKKNRKGKKGDKGAKKDVERKRNRALETVSMVRDEAPQPREQILGPRALMLDDDYAVEDGIIVNLCQPCTEAPEGHCTKLARPIVPTEAPRPQPPR